MHFVVEYEICALLFLSVIIFRFFRAKQFPNLQNRLFAIVLVIGFADIFLDVAGAFAIKYAPDMSPWVLFTINSCFYTMQIVLPVIVVFYVLVLTGHYWSMKRATVALLLIPAALLTLLLLTNPWSRLIFFVNSGAAYSRGPCFPLLYLGCLLYIVAAATIVIIYRSRLKPREANTILAFVAVVILSVALQILFPEYLLTGLAIALAITMMYFVIQNPEDMIDAMTGIFNRASMLLFIKSRIERKRDYQIIGVDIDEMRRINNLFSLEMGNQVLIAVAEFLSKISKEGWVFRLMNDRFVIITRTPEEYRQVLDAIGCRFQEPWIIGDVKLMLSVVVCHAEETDFISSPEELLRLFETAVPLAKKKGRGSVVKMDCQMIEKINRKLAVEEALREALETGGLEIYFQPIYSLKHRCFATAEVLLRFPHKIMGMIPPDEFIPIAEREGLIVKIDELVIRKVCGFIQEYGPKENLGMVNLEINLSAVEFLQEHLPERIRGLVGAYEIDPDFLCFEVTETAATAAHDVLNKDMSRLNKDGFRFVLDDFGTGYANITRVTQLPFYAVKIDRGMLIANYESAASSLIFEDTLRMFKRLGLVTVVEGVETEEQVELLRELGVDYIQGFYFARPMPVPEFVDFLKKRISISQKKD